MPKAVTASEEGERTKAEGLHCPEHIVCALRLVCILFACNYCGLIGAGVYKALALQLFLKAGHNFL